MTYKTNNIAPKQAHCPKCGGRVFLEKDYYGWYEQCILCGYLRNCEVSKETNEEVITQSGRR